MKTMVTKHTVRFNIKFAKIVQHRYSSKFICITHCLIVKLDSSPDLLSKPIILDNTVKILQSESAKVDEKIAALQDFQGFVRDGDPMYIKQHFK